MRPSTFGAELASSGVIERFVIFGKSLLNRSNNTAHTNWKRGAPSQVSGESLSMSIVEVIIPS